MKRYLWIGLVTVVVTLALTWPQQHFKPLCSHCGLAVIAAVGEPPSIMPALVQETVGRDISDQIFEKLANLSPGKPPIDPSAYIPALAHRWSRVDSLTWRFQLRPNARWHDGRPVTSDDVAFSFEVFSDTLLGSAASYALAGRVGVVPEDSATFLIRFTEPSPEQLYDATYHVRILPKHIWQPTPRTQWTGDTALGRLVGSGPYRLQEWKRGEHLTLRADSLYPKRPGLQRAVWRFTSDPDAALNLVLSEQFTVMENVGGPDRAKRVVAADTSLNLVYYPSATYGFLGFNLGARGGKGTHPILGERETRRGLALAIDRPTLARAVFGPGAKAPPGPMSQLLWIWNDSIAQPQFNPGEAAKLLESAGWRKDPAGVYHRNGRPLSFDILVPSTSSSRRKLAEGMQEMWRRVGVRTTITTVDFPVFQERLAKGRFDAYVGAYLDEPSPRGLKDQWSRAGWAALNYGRYANPVFDSLIADASRTSDVARARTLWREAMDTLNADVPALFLYAPAHAAAVPKTFGRVVIDPYSWLHTLPEWRWVGS